MKRVRLSLLVVGLIATGCMQTSKRPQPPQTQTTAATKPVVEDVAAPPTPKLLSADELNSGNAKNAAQILDETLNKENK